jgi:multidrug efflux system membrane fusion protein
MNRVLSIFRMARPTLLGLLVLALAACGQQAQPAYERPPAPVTVAAAVERDTPLYLDAVGKCVANEVVSVQPQISGRIVKIHFADGADLKQGDLLFTIDPRPIQATVQQAEANVARDQAQARQAEANTARDRAAVLQAQAALTQARAQLTQAEANVGRDQAQLDNAIAQDRRYAELLRQGYVAREQADQVRTAMETAARIRP